MSTSLVRANTGFLQAHTNSVPRQFQLCPTEERITTVINATSKIAGSLEFQDGVKIDGRIKGDVTFGTDDGLLIVSKGATVEGNVSGPKALILGLVEGNLDIDGLLVLAPSAEILGNVRCGRLIIHDGATIMGSIESNRSNPSMLRKQEAAARAIRNADDAVEVSVGSGDSKVVPLNRPSLLSRFGFTRRA